jgi:hypothetical protein
MHFFYHQETFKAERLGRRVARVDCAKCGCEYFYELTRIGYGRSVAPYGLGVEDAKRIANESSQEDLNQRLSCEAELVPCPKCHWINDELVEGYRRDKFLAVAGIGIVGAFFGTIISLLFAWFISRGPAADRAAVPYCLFGGPALFLSFGGAMILLRIWLQRRIQPNQNFPLPPQLPPGSPPALVKSPIDGKLVPASFDHVAVDFPGEWIDFRVDQTFPAICCDCLGPATLEHAFQHKATSTIVLRVPRCEACAGRATRKSRIIAWATATCAILIAGGFCFWLQPKLDEVWLLALAFLPAALIVVGITNWAVAGGTDPLRVAGDASHGVLRLKFRNPEYAHIISKHLKASSGSA